MSYFAVLRARSTKGVGQAQGSERVSLPFSGAQCLLRVASPAWLERPHSRPPASHRALSVSPCLHLSLLGCVHTFSFSIGYQSYWTLAQSDNQIQISTPRTSFTNSPPELLDMRISRNCLERTHTIPLITHTMKK